MMKTKMMLLLLAAATIFVACNKDDDGADPYDPDAMRTIKLSMEAFAHTEFKFDNEYDESYEDISFPTDLSIDWGDGSVTNSNSHYYENSGIYYVTIRAKNLKWFGFSNERDIRTIDLKDCNSLIVIKLYNNALRTLDVSGLKALKELNCGYNDLTSLDVSGLKVLKELDCDYNDLTSLDIKGCSSLRWLDCSYNELSAEALNQIFKDLPQGETWTDEDGYVERPRISIYGNPGSEDCDRSIAEKKGWEFY